jgi:hypothetical protein
VLPTAATAVLQALPDVYPGHPAAAGAAAASGSAAEAVAGPADACAGTAAPSAAIRASDS